jgi:hypothetical protein
MATWGHSGGPHVLACAVLLPDLVTAAASLASRAPFDAEGLDYFAGMGQRNVDDTRLFLTDEAAARKKLDKDREELLAASPDDVARGIESMLTPTDAAAFGGELDEFMLSCTQDGRRRAARTCSRRPATANGWPSTFPAARPGCGPDGPTRRSGRAS